MHAWCILFTDLCRHHADIMQTSIQVCIWRNVLFTYAKYAQGNYADLRHTLCRLEIRKLRRLYADLVQTIIQPWHIQVFIWPNVLLSYAKYYMVTWISFKSLFTGKLPSFGFCRTYAVRGVTEGTAPCWLLPGVSTDREAGRPRVVWPIRSSAPSAGVSTSTDGPGHLESWHMYNSG